MPLRGVFRNCERCGLGTDPDFACTDRASAERLKAKLGETMTVRLGYREVALPVSCNIREIPLVRAYAAEGSQRLEWKPEPKWCVHEPFDYVVLVKISTEAAPAEVSRALRSLADSLDTQRRAAEQES